MTLLIDFLVIVILIAGIWRFREPRGARIGNMLAAFALLLAFVLILYRNGVIDIGTVAVSLAAGVISGYGLAKAVNMIQIPSMVAFQHGAGGVAAFLVSFVELTRDAHSLELVSEISGVLGLSIGALTFSGSMIASAKLANKMRQTPQVLPAHGLLLLIGIAVLLVLGTVSFHVPEHWGIYLYIFQIVLSVCFGILFSVRIGGADMPVLISFLNATAGLAAAFCGMVIENQLLIAFGATVAASGSILTHVMCKAMNRNIIKVFLPPIAKKRIPGEDAAEAASAGAVEILNENKTEKTDGISTAAGLIKKARKVIIIPGYGMALAKAQQEVAALVKKMSAMGKDVKYAIHPVAGRMPGHMNVLLAEVGVDYDMLVEMETINPDFPSTDLSLVIGACDVVNPAAIQVEGTPISGMPILLAHEAKNVICCNFDQEPGYSGVENPLYEMDHTVLLAGDAKKTVQDLLAALTDDRQAETTDGETDPAGDTAGAAAALAAAKNVVIIPGYGMALARAQFKIAELAALLTRRGVIVKYAIHPVAGRMPGHMNVILAEAEVDYDDLLEMDDVNPLFADTDVSLIVGACDVVNPTAVEQEGTPISGMPILNAHEAKKIIVCNFDQKPGYSGVPNPLYENKKTLLLLGDAKSTTMDLIASLQNLPEVSRP